MRVLLVLGLGLGSLAAQDLGINYQLARGRRLMEQRNFEFAVQHLERHKKKYGSDARVWLMQGECHFSLMQWSEAVQQFEQGVKLAPEKLGEVPDYPLALLKLGRLDRALALYEDLSTRDAPEDRANGEFGRALVFLYRGDEEQALARLRVASEFDPRSPKINYRLGVLLRARGDVAAAVRHLERVVAANGLHEGALHQLALAAMQRHDRAAAETWRARHRAVRRAADEIATIRANLAGRPGTDVSLLRRLADLHFEFRCFDEAKTAYAAVTASDPTAPEPRYRYAACLFELEDYHDSRLQLEQILARGEYEPARVLLTRIQAMFPATTTDDGNG